MVSNLTEHLVLQNARLVIMERTAPSAASVVMAVIVTLSQGHVPVPLDTGASLVNSVSIPSVSVVDC